MLTNAILFPNPVQRAQSERVAGLVTVVVPAYNAAQSLERCIDHVLGQTYPDIELIVVNDGSTDDTEAVAKKYGAKLQYLSQKNQGETAARNAGVSMARGEYITFVDHDDYWHAEFVATCVTFLKQHPEAIAVSVGSEHRTALQEGCRVSPAFLAKPSDIATSTPAGMIIERFYDFWHSHDHICAGSAMLRASLVQEAGGQRTDLVLSGDMEYWAYLATFGPWGFVPRVLLYVDGTQVPRGKLYQKFYNRYLRCATVESWSSRILQRLAEHDRLSFERMQGRVATMYIFAHVFVAKDREAKGFAATYRAQLEGKFGALWRAGLTFGWVSWKPMCILLRMRTRLQYWLADRRLGTKAL